MTMPDRYKTEGEGILEKEVKPFRNGGAHVYAPVAWKAATVKLLRVSDPDPTDSEYCNSSNSSTSQSSITPRATG